MCNSEGVPGRGRLRWRGHGCRLYRGSRRWRGSGNDHGHLHGIGVIAVTSGPYTHPRLAAKVDPPPVAQSRVLAGYREALAWGSRTDDVIVGARSSPYIH